MSRRRRFVKAIKLRIGKRPMGAGRRVNQTCATPPGFLKKEFNLKKKTLIMDIKIIFK
jgi:hypothetical protein